MAGLGLMLPARPFSLKEEVMRKKQAVCRVRSTALLGHWRSGRRWGHEWVEVGADEITDAMLRDTRIEVESIEVEVSSDDGER
jgi:hypothetical protein